MNASAPFTYADIQAVVGLDRSRLSTDFIGRGVSTDTRSIESGNIFIALTGEHFDGHNHVVEAMEKGASAAVVDQNYYNANPNNLKLICAPQSPLHTLGSLAWYHRRRFDIPVIAIAGAAGKTSTKDVAAHVLGSQYEVLKTKANYNNQIGTPLTLLGLTAEHTAAVIEIGTNQPGEIELLAAMVQPTHGLITNIGKEHLEQLIDLDGVEREECALFEYLNDTGGVCFVNVDDERLQKYAYTCKRVITFGISTEADIHPRVSFDDQLLPALHMAKGELTFRASLKTPGLAAVLNSTCAIALAWSLGIPAAEIRHGLSGYDAPATKGYGRMVVEASDYGTIINDSYNANPESMQLALQTLKRFPKGRKIAVLGDMLELGDASETEHMQVLDAACQIADVVIVHGSDFRRAQDHINGSNVVWCSTHSGCANAVIENTNSDSVILIKGSRGLAMENVVDALIKRSN